MANILSKIDSIIIDTKDCSSLVSNIKWVKEGQGKNPKGTLYLKFKSNNTSYEYSNVPLNTLHEMLLSESIGSYFHENIKDVYNTRKEI